MKTDRLEERLAARFAEHLREAERDYRKTPRLEPVRAANGVRGIPLRLAVPVAGLAAVLAVVAVSVGIALRSGPGPAGNPGGSGVVIGSDGIPTSIDGQHVYRIGDVDSFPPSGSFLLAGYVVFLALPCPYESAQPSADAALVGFCNGLELSNLPAPRYTSEFAKTIPLAPESFDSMGGISLADRMPPDVPVILRVHTHDAMAGACTTSLLDQCQAAAVVDSIAWIGKAPPSEIAVATPTATPPDVSNLPSVPAPPTPISGATTTTDVGPLDADGVPKTINGQPVYRNGEAPPVAAQFMIGGRLSYVCPGSVCSWQLDGLAITSDVPVPDSAKGNIFVVMVAVHRQLVACPNSTCTKVWYVITDFVYVNPFSPPPPLGSPDAGPS